MPKKDTFKKYNEELYLWKINYKKNYNFKYFNLDIRDYLENNNDLSIDDMLLINNIIVINFFII